MGDLIRFFGERFGQVPRMRLGTVTAVSNVEGLDVAYGGGGLVTGLQKHRSYANPGVGDVVMVVSLPGRMWVMDALDNGGTNLGPNLAPNPGFEFGAVGATPSSWNSLWSTTPGDPGLVWINSEVLAHSSGAAAEFSPGGLATGQNQQLSMNDAVVVDPLISHRLGVWFRGSSADANTAVTLRAISAPTSEGAQPFGTDSSSVDIATTTSPVVWTEISGLRTPPAGHFFLRIFLIVTANAGRTVTNVYADDVSLRRQN